MVDDFVGAKDIVLVVDDDFAGQSPGVTDAGLLQGFPADGGSGLGQRFGFGDGEELLTGVVRDWIAGS